jgi:glyoxylase-like metal-dependent hydrolase (beta-lactamase superfamily II)
MRITFLGTRGNIEMARRRHRRHSALMIRHGGRRVMVDCGADWLGRVAGLAPDAIVLTHAHADHAEGLRAGAPCPVHASAETWAVIGGYPIAERRSLAPGVREAIAGIGFRAWPVQHSLRCPAVGYRIDAGGAAAFYLPDVAAFPDHLEALAGIALFIGDGASITRPILRERDGVRLGHAPIRAQLGWCRNAGVRVALFTHCGSEIVGGDERRLGATVRALAREHGMRARIAYDGLEIDLP